MHDDYGVTYAVYDRDRIPQLMRSPGPVSGGTQREMTMARIPEGLARELIQWAATAWRVDDSSGDVYCHYCGAHEPIGGEADHTDDCLHIRAMYWLAAEKAARAWRPGETHPALKAKAVNRD